MNAYPALIEAAMNTLASQVSEQGTSLQRQIAQAVIQSDLNFVTRTPAPLSYNLGGVTEMYVEWRRATVGMVTLAVVVGGLAVLGRQYFGWTWPIPDNAGRIIMGVILITSMPFLYAMSIEAHNAICDAIAMADLPGIGDAQLDPWANAVLLVIWVIFGVRLLIRMAYRLVYFVVLLAVGPLAAMCLFIPGAQDYWRMWLTDYVGLLVGQVLVVICLKLSAAIVGAGLGGSIGGIAISLGVLLLAYDLATVGADIKGGGVGKIVKQVVATAAVIF